LGIFYTKISYNEPMQTAVFDTLYKKLNKPQREAVDAIEGPVMVIAGPGTGKTTILTLRIANILKRTDTPANGILAITYTDAGVKAMRQKLQGIIGDRAHDVRIHTFHGFASSVIAEYPDHFLHLSDLKQMTDIEQESLIRAIISDPKFSDIRPAGKPDAYVSGIIRSIDDAKREALTPEMVRQFARDEIERIKNDEESISTRGATKGQLKADAKEMIEKFGRTILFGDVYELYEAKKLEAKKMDFNDLIIELLLALRRDELLLRLLQERYLYLHVDEHQDTNDAQNFIVGLIAEFFDTPNIFIVGDEKQAIYRFQSASVDNFLLLQKKWPAMKLISLDTNYRSHQSILDASFGMIEKNYEEGEHADLRIRLKSGSNDEERPIDVVVGENVSAIELHLVNQLHALTEKEPKATAAIIVRRNRDLDRVIRLLESHHIPVSSERSVDIFSHPVGRLFFNLIEYLVDSSKTDALARTVIAGMWNIPFEKGAEVVKLLRSGQPVEIGNLLKIQRSMLNDGAIGFIIHAAEESGFTALVARNPSYIHVWRGIVSLAESLTRGGDLRDPAELIRNMLAYRTSAETRTVKVSVGAPDVPIQALTAHGSKGLEFDYVFIPYATEESWIGRPKGASFILPKKRTADSDIRDVRRLFYVALTRGRKHVTVLTAREESDGKMLEPLRFIEELDEKHVAHAELPRVGVNEVHVTKNENEGSVDPEHEIGAKLIDITKHTLLTKGLSVTALNHFLECANTFLYQSILKLPQAPSVPAEKGTAMHAAFDSVWNSKKKVAVEIEALLIEKITEYFDTSFLPSTEKESAKKELLADVSAVSKALESHFAQPENVSVFTESWVETEFVGTYNSPGGSAQTVRIPLHGKLDVIIDTGTTVYVYDYKTRQAMSVNAIKGETKTDSSGNYFRQLIFYKMLLQNDPRWRSRSIIPALVFVSPDEKGRCPTVTLPIEQVDIDRVNKEIQSLIDAVWSGEIAHAQCDDMKCEWCGVRGI
jgi:DNA helicase-2/ATP-dependent DNA helicase PcrA